MARRATGKQVYGADLKLPGMLNAAIKVLSTVPRRASGWLASVPSCGSFSVASVGGVNFDAAAMSMPLWQ